ncbi:MAG: tetratricopeptide repeat protein [Bacteroidia bacterium]|nr:tetratricopeptide repeat protein [Bacteroidia bacterium]
MKPSTSEEVERQRRLVDELNAQAYDERYNNTTLSLRLASDALEKARALAYVEGQGWALRNLGIAHAILGHLEEAESRFQEALAIFERLEDMRGLGLTLSNLGTVYQQMGRMEKAVEYLGRSLRYLQLIPDLAFFYAQTLANLGSLFGELEHYELGREYHEKALQIHQGIGAQRGMFFCLVSLGSFYQRLQQYQEAEARLQQALDIAMELGEEDLVVRALLSQAQLLNDMDRSSEALVRLEQAEKLLTDIANPSLRFFLYTTMADAYVALDLLEKAEETLSRLDALRRDIREGVAEYFLPEIRARLAEKQGKYEQAFQYYKDYVQRRTALQRAVTQNTLSTLEKVLREDLLGAEREAAADLGVARRIQEVLLHGEAELRQVFPECAYWILPKSLVSGDFLWVGRGKEGARVLAVVDASGAGVSAAILCTIAHTLLYEIVSIRGVTDPGRILSQLHKSLLDLLYPSAKTSFPEMEDMQAEGFQVGVCTVLASAGEVHYAGAHIPLWVYNPMLGWEQLQPDKRLIGQKVQTEETSPRLYTSTIIPVEKQWVLVFMTDGWERQVRASDGKRYGRSAVRDYLLQHPPKDLEDWVKGIQQEFDTWREGAAPTDDILLAAVRI